MCDTFFLSRGASRFFAKNSDRDPNEPQYLERFDRGTHGKNDTITCTYMTIPQITETYAYILSRPSWMWGGEMGVNEFGVAIGNEAVFTKKNVRKVGLTGMDLLRLALERACSATQAVEVISQLIKEHGQGGNCGFNSNFYYHNSFIVADAESAFILETVDDLLECREVIGGVGAISNELTISDLKEAYSDKFKSWVAGAHKRRALILNGLQDREQMSPDQVFALLRSHGKEAGAEGKLAQYHWFKGAMNAPCMHAGGLAINSQTTASMVYDFREKTLWLTGTSTPCLSLFKRLDFNDDNIGMQKQLWHQHEMFSRRIAESFVALEPEFYREQEQLEAAWLQKKVSFAEASRIHFQFISLWSERLAAEKNQAQGPSFMLKTYWKMQKKNTQKIMLSPGKDKPESMF